jgi:hypothetical protein
MLKRFVARLLIVLQIYGNLFQGVAHGNFADHHAIQNEIYVHSSIDKHGSLRLSLGTDHGTTKDPELLELFEVPSYKSLVTPPKPLQHPVVDLVDVVETEMFGDVESLPGDLSFESNGITRKAEGTYFTIQGLEVFINNDHEMLVQGRQTDFSKPIFLSGAKSIILNNVDASSLKLLSPSILGVGRSTIDFLSLEGLTDAAVFINGGSLTAKEIFLKNLSTSNLGKIETVAIEAQAGTLKNTGTLEAETKITLGVDSFTNSGVVTAESVQGLEALQEFANTSSGRLSVDELFRTGAQTAVINHGSFTGGDYQFTGPSLLQNGKMHVKSLRTEAGTEITTDASQELVVEDTLVSKSRLPWQLLGSVRAKEFTHLGRLDLAGDLTTALFTGHGSIQATGKLKSEQSRFIDDLTNLGKIDTQILQAEARLSTHGKVHVRRTARVMGSFTVGSEGSFTGYEGEPLTLSLHDAADIAGKVDVDHLDAKAIHLSGSGQLLAAQNTTIDGDLAIEVDAKAQLKALRLSGDTKITNHGKLVVEGVDTKLGILQITNSGVVSIDNAQVLPKASEQSPKNLARNATTVGPVTWYSGSVDAEFDGYNPLTHKRAGSKYLSLFKALSAKEAYVYDYKIDPEFTSLQGLSLKIRATQHKRGFEKLYESLVALSLTSGNSDEQTQLQQYLQPFESHYKQIFTARNYYAKTLPPAMGTALVVESSSVPAVKLQLLNQTPGELTLKSGRFEFVGSNALVNDGTIIQDSAYTLWLTNVPGEFNRGTWKATGSLGLLGYQGKDLGKLEVDGALRADTSVDGGQALFGMKAAKAKQIILHAPRLVINEDKQFAMPVALHIQDMFSLQAKLTAPAFIVNARTLELGSGEGGWGVLSAYQESIDITVTSLNNSFGHIIAMQDAQITVNGDEFINGACLLDPGYVEPADGVLAYEYPRKRNGAAISVGRHLRVAVRGQNALLNNNYGLMQADGYLDLFSQKQMSSMSGIISAKGGGLLSAPEIIVKREDRVQKPYGARFCDGHFYYKKGCQVRDSCSGGGRCSQAHLTREQSDEGWINVGGGDLEIDTDSLTVLASHIVSKGRLLLKRQGIDLPKTENGALTGINGILVQSRQDSRIYYGMCRNGQTAQLPVIHKAGIFSYSDMQMHSHGLKIEGISATQTMDVVRALTQTVQSAGFDVTTDQARDLLIDLVSGAKYQANESHSLITHLDGQFVYDLPFERIEVPTYGRGPMPVLTDSYAVFDATLRQGAYLQHTVSKMVLESLLDNLVMKALRNPQRTDFSRKLYENSQVFAVNNMKQRLLQSSEAKTEEEAENIVAVRYNQLIPITYQDMSVYARDVKVCAKQMLLFELGANYRAIDKLKRMEDALDQEICDLRPKVFVPKESVPTDKTSATVHSDGALTNTVRGDMTLRGEAQYSSHGGTTKVDGTLLVEALAMRQGDVVNFQEQSSRPLIRNLGNNNALNFMVDQDVMLTGALIDTGGKDNTINIFTPGRIIDTALGVSSRSTTHSRSKRSHTVTVVDETLMQPTEYFGLGAIQFKSDSGVFLQAPEITCKVSVNAPYLGLSDAHNQRSVQSTTETYGRRGLFGGSTKKTTQSMIRSLFSQGGKLKGPEFIAHVQQFSATNTEFDTQAEITATEKVDLLTGTSNTSSHTQTVYKGVIWNKVSSESQKHLTHQACSFRQPATFHTPDLTMERVRGSGVIENLHSDTPVQYRDMIDVHEHHQHSQKSLSAGAALITKLAVGLILYSNPVTFGLGGTPGVMVNAGFGALCSDAATNLIEQDGDPFKAITAMSRNGTAMNIARAMVTAGLVKEFGDAVGVKSGFEIDTNGKLIERTISDYAKQAVISSAVNTVMSVAIDGQDFRQAMLHGINSAALNTVASWGAGQIGTLYSQDALNYGVHKALHGLVGTGLGAGLATISKTDPRVGAVSGLFGAVLSEMIAEGFKPEMTDVEQYVKDNPGTNPKEVQYHFMERAQSTANWSAFASAVGAFSLDMDPLSANTSARNALDHNFEPTTTIAIALMVGVMSASPQYWRDLETDEPHVALKKLGINTAKDSIIALAAGCAFEVAGVACKTMSEAVAVVVARNPMLKSVCARLESRFAKIEAYVKDQFDYKKHFVNNDKIKVNLDPKNVHAHELYKQELRIKMERPYAEDPKLIKMLEKFHRPGGKVGSGSTAASLRHELNTGELVGGVSHIQKTEDSITALNSWLKNNPMAKQGDRAAAENMLRDLLEATRGLLK